MEIYHGSYTIIEHPKLMDRRFTKDFGNGFYCTILRHQAERWAGRYNTSIIDIYVIDALILLYNSWIVPKIDNYNSSMYYENTSYQYASYQAGKML